MAELHITDADVANNFAAVLKNQGAEVIVEHDHQPVAVLRPVLPARARSRKSWL